MNTWEWWGLGLMAVGLGTYGLIVLFERFWHGPGAMKLTTKSHEADTTESDTPRTRHPSDAWIQSMKDATSSVKEYDFSPDPEATMQSSLKNVGQHILTNDLKSKWQQRLDAIEAKEKNSLFHSLIDRKDFKALLDSGSDPNEREDDELQNTILMEVARKMGLPFRWRIELSMMLISGGADINAVNTKGQTALSLAAAGFDPTLALFLLDAGADPRVGNTLEYARENCTDKKTLLALEEAVDARSSEDRVLIMTPEEVAKPWYMLDDDELDISSKIVGVSLPTRARFDAEDEQQAVSNCTLCGHPLNDGNSHGYCGTLTRTLNF